MVHSDDQGGMLEDDQLIGEQRDAGIQVEEVNPEDNIVKTAWESQQERLEVHIYYELGMYCVYFKTRVNRKQIHSYVEF